MAGLPVCALPFYLSFTTLSCICLSATSLLPSIPIFHFYWAMSIGISDALLSSVAKYLSQSGSPSANAVQPNSHQIELSLSENACSTYGYTTFLPQWPLIHSGLTDAQQLPTGTSLVYWRLNLAWLIRHSSHLSHRVFMGLTRLMLTLAGM